jgi:hypothetical protein
MADTASETASAAVETMPLLGLFLDFDAVEDVFVPVDFFALAAGVDRDAEPAADL